MTDQNMQDLLEALAGQLHVAAEGFKMELIAGQQRYPGIPVGAGPADQIPYLDSIDYREGARQVWLRLTNGEAWLLRVHKMGSRIAAEPEVGLHDTLSSYCRYKALQRQWLVVLRTAESAGLDTELLAQAYHDDTLGDDERADWDRWTSCGTASAAEWAYINRKIDQGDLTV